MSGTVQVACAEFLLDEIVVVQDIAGNQDFLVRQVLLLDFAQRIEQRRVRDEIALVVHQETLDGVFVANGEIVDYQLGNVAHGDVHGHNCHYWIGI